MQLSDDDSSEKAFSTPSGLVCIFRCASHTTIRPHYRLELCEFDWVEWSSLEVAAAGGSGSGAAAAGGSAAAVGAVGIKRRKSVKVEPHAPED